MAAHADPAIRNQPSVEYGRFGGCAMVSLSGAATKFSAGSGLPSSVRDLSFSSSPSSTSGAGVPALLGFSLSLARTVVAGWSETSRSTVSISQSGGR